MIRFIQIRCPTLTQHGICNRWQHEIGADTPDGVAIRFRCKHCKETTLTWSSQVTRAMASAHAR